VRRSYETRLQTRGTELQTGFAQKKAEKQQRMTEIQSNFGRDLAHKQELINADNEAKITEFTRSYEEEHSLNAENKDHLIEMKKTKARLDFINRQLLVIEKDHRKKVTVLSSDICRLEKAKRQIERRKKTETQAIDNDYEMKIQIAQVHLRNTIEHIAKLYTADENERGSELIQAIRQVRETNNYTDDVLFRRGHERESMRQSFTTTASERRAEIARVASSEKESEVLHRIEQKRVEVVSQMSELDARIKLIKDSLGRALTQEKASNREALAALQSLADTEKTEHEQHCQAMATEKRAVVAEEKAEIDKFTAEFNEKRVKCEGNHSAVIQKMRERITSALRQRDELAAKYAVEEENQQKQIALSETNVEIQTPSARADLSATLAIILKNIREAEPPSRPIDQKRIETLSSRIQSLDDLIESTFESFALAIKEGPRKPPEKPPLSPTEPEMPRPTTPGTGRNPNNSVSRGSRHEISRVVTPVDPKMRKKPQVLITPQ
jgi:hypothetical protein